MGRTSARIEGEVANFLVMKFDYRSCSSLLYDEDPGVAPVP
jgi:hypothetical protein